MAFLLSGLSLPGNIVANLLGGQIAGQGKTTLQPHPLYASSFGTVLQGQVGAMGTAAPLVRLTAVVQNGTPIDTIVNRLAENIAGGVGRQLPQLGGAAARARLAASVRRALSPPSNAPPGATAEQQVSALARRLQQWLAGVAREADLHGQQSDTSGHVLDAKSAKELPAQNGLDPNANASADPSALAQALLARVAASFATTSAQPLVTSQSGVSAAVAAGAQSLSASVKPAQHPHASPAGITEAAMSRAAKETATLTSAVAQLQGAVASAVARGTATAAKDAAAAAEGEPNASAQPSQAVPAKAQQPQVQPPSVQLGRVVTTAAPAPSDLVARMLARAAGVDAQLAALRQAPAEADSAATHEAAPVPVQRDGVNSGGTSQPSVAHAAARVVAALSDTIAGAAPSNGGTSQRDGSTNANGGPQPSFAPTSANAAAPAASAAPFAATLSQAPATPPAPAHAPAQAMVDPTAVVEQVVKSMAMRSNSDGTSELRLRLVPDSLGTVTMKLTVSGSNVSATAIAQTPDARNALVANQQHLTRSLADSGLKLTSFNVNLSSDLGQHDGRNHDRASGFGRHYAVHEVAASSEPDSTESSNGGPSIVPGSLLGLFNYLA